MNEEKLKEELEKREREIALDSKNVVAYFKRRNVSYTLGRKEEVLESYDYALKINLEDNAAYCHRENVLSESLKVLTAKNCLSVDYLPVIHEGDEYPEKVIAGPKLKDFTNLVDVAKFRLHRLGGKKNVEFYQSQAPLS